MYDIYSDIKLNISHKALTLGVWNPFLSLLFILRRDFIWNFSTSDISYDATFPPPPYLYNVLNFSVKNISELCHLIKRQIVRIETELNEPHHFNVLVGPDA